MGEGSNPSGFAIIYKHFAGGFLYEESIIAIGFVCYFVQCKLCFCRLLFHCSEMAQQPCLHYKRALCSTALLHKFVLLQRPKTHLLCAATNLLPAKRVLPAQLLLCLFRLWRLFRVSSGIRLKFNQINFAYLFKL